MNRSHQWVVVGLCAVVALALVLLTYRWLMHGTIYLPFLP
jgi:hypothetical protein